ncbi:MAG TPA: MFS transporter [Gaiellaceae bacterium]|nr:MFS transporter [Gaiellaceae bacterium]
MRELLRHRDARLLLAGQTLSAFGDWAMLIVLAVWMKSLTGSSAAAGMTFFVFGAGSLCAPAAGLLADRVRKRPLMIAVNLLLGGMVLLLLLVHQRGDAWLIYLVALLYGLGGTVYFPARSALLRLMLPEELLADANGALSATREGLRIVAPLAGAGLYAWLGGGSVAVLDSATFLGSAIFIARMRLRETAPERTEHRFMREVTAGFRHVWATPALRYVIGGVAVAMLVIGFAETLIFYVIAALGKSPSFFGVFSTIQGVGSIAGGVTAAGLLRRIGEVSLVGLGLAAFAVADLALTVPSLPVVALAGPLAGVGVAWAIVGFGTVMQTRTPLALQGRVASAGDLLFSVAQTVSIATGAALSTVVDWRLLFVVMAVVVLGSAGFLLTRRVPALTPATMEA